MTERRDVEEVLVRDGVAFEWTASNSLKISYRRTALEVHPVTGERVWFNQADQWHPSGLGEKTRRAMESILKPEDYPLNVVFGDGTPIPDEDIAVIRSTLWDHSVSYQWEEGDVLLLDNMLMAHGRKPYRGPRRVYVALA
jgi:hypothetical protein